MSQQPGIFDDFAAQAKNPAAPAGLAQAATQGAGAAAGQPGYANNSLGQWLASSYGEAGGTYADQAQSWFTGANRQGESNGWNTDFMAKAQASYDNALAAGEAATQFDSKVYGTGVVLWDHTSADNSRSYSFGDVYVDGVKQGNVYEQFDKPTADLMMGQLMFKGEDLGRMLASGNTDELSKNVDEQRQRNNTDIPQSLAAQAFQDKVDARTESLAQGGSGAALVAGSAAGGAATGAGVGAALTAWLGPGALAGAAVGGVVGGVLGGIGGWMNRDELAQGAARAYEVTKAADAEYGRPAAIATGLSEWSGVAMKMTSPVTQVTHGLQDQLSGGAGDLESAFYAVDDKGNSTTGAGWKVLSVGAAVGDGLLQFASPLGRGIYMAEMGGNVGGEVTGLTLRQGSVFDPREGGFDNIFRDEQGNAAPLRAAAGILDIGIDAVQLGGWGALSRTLGRQTTALRAGSEPLEGSGFKFITDEAGNVVGKRAKIITLLAPSEQFAAWSTAHQARLKAMRRAAAGGDGAVTADDFYRASMELASGSNRLRTAMVNAFGEGYEEVAQSLLEPYSTQGKITGSDVANAWFYGAAGGLGMSLGATLGRGGSQADRTFAAASANYSAAFGVEMPREMFDSMSETEQKSWASLSELEKGALGSAVQEDTRRFATELVASTADEAAARDARRQMVDRELKGGQSAIDDYTVITGIAKIGDVDANGMRLAGTLRAEALRGSALKVSQTITDRLTGILSQVDHLEQRVTDLTGDANLSDELQRETELLAQTRAAAQVGKVIRDAVVGMVNRIYDEATTQDEARALIADVNRYLERAFSGRASVTGIEGMDPAASALAAAKFTSVLFAREPKLHPGSVHAFLPQIDERLTFERGDDMWQLNVDYLTGLGGDFDGDKLHPEYQVILDHERWLQSRAGSWIAAVGEKVDLSAQAFDSAEAAALAEGLRAPLVTTLRSEADAAMSAIGNAITKRYGSFMSTDVLDSVLGAFRDRVMAGLDPAKGEEAAGARSGLVQGLMEAAGQQIDELGRNTLTNEWLWISMVVRSNMQKYQRAYSRDLAASLPGPTGSGTSADVETLKSTNVKKREAVNDAQTVAVYLPGTSLFRKFMKIHLVAYNAAMRESENADPNDVMPWVRLYRELGQNVTDAELSMVQADDSISARVLVMLGRLVDSAIEERRAGNLGAFNPSTAMLVFANMRVPDDVTDENGNVQRRHISLAQQLLRMALAQEREKFSRTFERNTDLQKKHARLMPLTQPGDMNAERAAFEVFKAVPHGDLLGDARGLLPASTTPEQWLAQYLSLDAAGKQAEATRLKDTAYYLDRKEKTNLPYLFTEMERGEISSYRAMVDILLATGNSMLSFDPNLHGGKDYAGAFKGEFAETNQRAIRDFMTAHAAVRDALKSFRSVFGRKGSNPEQLQQLFESDPFAARRLWALIPPAARNALFEQTADGELRVVNWFYEVFSIKDPKHALASFWANSMKAAWFSTKTSIDEVDTEDGPGRLYWKLNSRFQRLLYILAQEPGQFRMAELLKRMTEATDIDEFTYWLNTTPGIVPMGWPPLLPFVDDVSVFEADSTGGWVSSTTSADMRTALTDFSKAAVSLKESMAARATRRADTTRTVERIRGLLKAGNESDPLVRKWRKMLAASHALPTGVGPNIMGQVLRGGIVGFDAQSHNKGVTAPPYRAFGEAQHLLAGFGYMPNLERVMEAVTSRNLSSLATNLGMVVGTSGKAMDEFGNDVTWDVLDDETALRMLEDPRSEPLALALLAPSALDVSASGALSRRPLLEPSLKSLLNGSSFKSVYPRTESEALTLDQAMRYLTLVDQRARALGDEFSIIRYASNLAIARLASLDRTLDDSRNDAGRLADQTFIDVAKALQTLGRVQASPNLRDSGMLESLREGAVAGLRQAYLTRALPDFVDTTGTVGPAGQVAETFIRAAKADLDARRVEELRELGVTLSGDELDLAVAATERKFEAAVQRLDQLMSTNRTEQLISMYQLTGSMLADVPVKNRIIEEVTATAGFSMRVPEAEAAFTRLAEVIHSGERPEMSPRISAQDWDVLSRAATTVRLNEETYIAATHVSLNLLPANDPTDPDGKHFKLFDRAYTYLATDLIDPDSKVLEAATWLHMMAEQPTGGLTDKSVTSVLSRTVLNPALLNTWTDSIVAQQIEVQGRISSAATPGAVKASGMGPRRQDAAIAATRATDKTDGIADKLTNITIRGSLLASDADPFAEIPVNIEGKQATTMPLVQLDNRFYAGVKFNGVEMPLSYNNMGFTWNQASTQLALRYISLPRLQRALARFAEKNKLELDQIDVELDFLHPDSQPAGEEFMHNGWYEGKSHSLLPDGSESLIGSLWSSTHGEIEQGTQFPLKLVKKGGDAFSAFVEPDAADLAEAELEWEANSDLAAMLRKKAALVMRTPRGMELSYEHFNAIYKWLKLSHLVAVDNPDTGRQVLTAEDYIARRLAGEDFGQSKLKLVVLSSEVLRSMMGHTGDQGIPRWTGEEFQLHPELIAQYTKVTEAMVDRFGKGWFSNDRLGLADTRLRHVGAANRVAVRSAMQWEELNKHADRIVMLARQRSDVHEARMEQDPRERWRAAFLGSFEGVKRSLQSDRHDYAFRAVNAGAIERIEKSDADHSIAVLQDLLGDAYSGYERAFEIYDHGTPQPINGVLTVEDLSGSLPKHHQIVKDDLAMVMLENFDQAARSRQDTSVTEQRLERALTYLVNTGATIVLSPGPGTRDMRFEAGQFLLSMGYVAVNGSTHVFAPMEFAAQTQNQRAYESTMYEKAEITPAYNAVTFLTIDPIGTTENGAIVNPATRKLREHKVLQNIIPSSRFPGFNVAEDDVTDAGAYNRAVARILQATDESGPYFAELVKMAAEKQPPRNYIDIRTALRHLHERVSDTGSVMPEEGSVIQLGDIIPFVDELGRVIMYRHGLKPPKNLREAEVQFRTRDMGVALAKTEVDDMITANSGTIGKIDLRSGYGRRLTLELPLQLLGDKVILDYNGMKYILMPMPDGTWVPTAPLSDGGLVVDLWSDLESANAKQAVRGRITNYRNALAFFGFDFLEDMTKFFFPDADPTDATYQRMTYNVLQEISADQSLKIPPAQARELTSASRAVSQILGDLDIAVPGAIDPTWVDRVQSPLDITDRIAQAVLIYLLTPHANLHNVLQASGFFHSEAASDAIKTIEVPGLFADLLDTGIDSPVHAEFIRRWNDKFAKHPDGSGYRLRKDWLVEAYGPNRTQVKRGYLQYGETHSSGDNPVTNAEAHNPRGKSSASVHNTLVMYETIGARTVAKPLKKSAAWVDSFKTPNRVLVAPNEEQANIWQAFTWLPDERLRMAKDGSLLDWRRDTATAVAYRAMAREEVIGFFAALKTGDRNYVSEVEEQQYRAKVEEIMRELKAYGGNAGMVDSWVRMHLGAPYEIDEHGNERGQLSGKSINEAAVKILQNVRSGLMPTFGAMVPLMDVNQVTVLFQLGLNREGGWAPEGVDRNADKLTQWQQWQSAAFGTSYEGTKTYRPRFDAVFQLAVDGMMHGWQRASRELRALPVTLDVERLNKLYDPETNTFLASLNPNTNQLASDPVRYNTSLAQLDDILRDQRIYAADRRTHDPNSAQAGRFRRLEAWRKQNQVPRPERHTVRGINNGGQVFIDESMRAGAIWRMALNLRAAQVLWNPLLWVSAPVEAAIRRTVDLGANLAVGESLTGLGQAQRRLMDVFTNLAPDGLAADLGLNAPITAEQYGKLKKLANTLASRRDFRGMLFADMVFHYPSIAGIGKWEKRVEYMAKRGALLQDFSRGMLPRDLATKYVEAALRNHLRNPLGENVYSLDTLIAGLNERSDWLEKNDIEAHRMALAAVANVRSMKGTTLSFMTRGIIEPMAESSHGVVVNSTGNFLKMLTMFQNFWTTWAVNTLGLQAADQFMAMLVDGRQKKLGLRLQAALRGDPQPDFASDDPQYYDMTPLIESVDLADAFIRGGVTHSMLFLAGMMAQGLGLSGEDDERKWRRRQAELQGAALMLDPNDLAEDFRNKGAIYLDFLPPFLAEALGYNTVDTNGNVHAIAQMNWIGRTFLSPVLGMERFFETGNFHEVIWGFQDSVGAHPIMNQEIWAATLDTVNALHRDAAASAEAGTPEGYSNSASLLLTAVGIMERFMFENATINMIYQGVDRYDRDPYKQVRTDSDNNVQVDARRNPTPTDALQQFVAADGTVQNGYISRDGAGADYRALSENRAGLALLGSLFTGLSGDGFFSSDMIRYNMVPKTRDIELMPTSQRDAADVVLAAWHGMNRDTPDLTQDEIASRIKAEYRARGEWYNQTEVDRMAHAEYLQRMVNNDPLSTMVDGREMLTDRGRLAVIRGLWNGSVQLGDASLSGIYITQDQRNKLTETLRNQITAEGLALGLDRYTAEQRMKRIFFGPLGHPDEGLYSILKSDQISWQDTVSYNQLNTTYVMGPDGLPWATGFTREGLLGALGLRWLNRPIQPADTGLGVDSRLNSVDQVVGINTGLRGLERRGQGFELPTTEEEFRKQTEAIIDAIKDMDSKDLATTTSPGTSGYTRYGSGYGYSSHGGGGGGGYSGSTYFDKMYALPNNISVYGNTIPFINTSNPIIRRADVRRERVWSERGRLKQWQ